MSAQTGNMKFSTEDLSANMANRRYRHYKGGEYTVLCVGTQEATGVPQVVYAGADSKVWIRPLDEFLSDVQVDGRQEQRFYWIRD